MNVVRINSETLEAFIRRERVTNTAAVAYRFGLQMEDARRQLAALERAGIVTKKRAAFDYCAMNEWRLA